MKKKAQVKAEDRTILGYNVAWIRDIAGKDHPDYEKVKKEAKKQKKW